MRNARATNAVSYSLCITLPVESALFFIPSTSSCSLSWFTSSCTHHIITVPTFDSSITASAFYSRLKTPLFRKSFPVHSLSDSSWTAFTDLRLGLDHSPALDPGCRLQDSLWDILQQQVYSHKIQNMDELRQMGTPGPTHDRQFSHNCMASMSSLLCGCKGRTFRANVKPIMCQSDSIF